MEYQYQGIELEKALELCLTTVKHNFTLNAEKVRLEQAVGRIAARDYAALFSQPPFNRSAVDGYAVRVSDIERASEKTPVLLKVIGEVNAGDLLQKDLERNSAVRIMTGAPVPNCANGVLRQEDTDYGENYVNAYKSIKIFENICFQGEEYNAGTRLITKNTKLKSIEIGMLAGMGYAEVEVYKKPRIGLFTTGDELINPGELLTPGKIYNSNQYLLFSRLHELGAEPVLVEKLPDSEKEVANCLQRAANQVDLIITTGGVSVGKRDIMHEALNQAKARRIFWKVKIKPGAPTIFAMLNKIPVIALSGNPYGALANMELLVRPVLHLMSGSQETEIIKKKAAMQCEYKKHSSCKRFIRGIYKDGMVSLPEGLQTSGVLRTMQGCNCLIEIKADSSGLMKGDEVEVVLLY